MTKENMNWATLTIEELALIIGQHLSTQGIDAVLVGGACVSIYSKNKYESGDLDFVSYEDDKKIRKALLGLGFILEPNKYYKHAQCPYFLEFINPPIAIGAEPVFNFKCYKRSFGQIKMLTPTDCVKDRLSAYYHWNDFQSLDQALLVAQEQKIDLANVKRWSSTENQNDKFLVFLGKLKRGII